eukprot:TRINITY_DN28723_c0_g1_i1.p1 TRINITY_DN28723_c0_g1~~TRINITY_DN28723_c0_g1_i1.p1  ORF type:complete len:724 (-),score=214.48 TRINITY_DN28723_c0_g1_i1:85-2256(-)
MSGKAAEDVPGGRADSVFNASSSKASSTDTAAEVKPSTPEDAAVAGYSARQPASSTSSPNLLATKSSCSASECRRQMDPASLEEALEVAAQCAAIEQDGQGDWVDNIWEQAVKLRHLLSLAAQPDFVPPARFQQAMETCMSCLLHAPQGHLMHPEHMLKLLDSPDADPLLKYLSWLEEALKGVTSSSSGTSGGASCRTVLVPQRVRSALCSWPAERSLLQQSAAALWEALSTHGPRHLRKIQEWRKTLSDREAIQTQQTEDCKRVAQDIESVASFFVDKVNDNAGVEWTQLARVTQESLWQIQQASADLLQSKQECWSSALEDYEALGSKASACRAAITEVRRQVRRHEQAFSQAAQRFTEVANQLVAWTSVLVPKLRLLEGRRAELRAAVELRQKLPALEREHLQAEDELDTAQTELRKHRRHSQASAAQRSKSRPANSTDHAAAAFILERQCELRISNAQKRVNALVEQLRDAEKRLKEAEAVIPFDLDWDEEGPAAESSSGAAFESLCRDQMLSNEERLALKLATLQQFHEEMVVEVSQTQVQRDKILRKVEQRKVQAALRRHVEPDFMCPILHERMRVPVLAADGFTYERQAIEKWLSMHNTSPMTGALLAHRYLTENYALRHLIDAYDAQLVSSEKSAKGKRTGDKAKSKRDKAQKEETDDDGEPEPEEAEEEEEEEEEEDLEEDDDEEDWDDDEESIPRGVQLEEDMPILSHQMDDG